MHKGQLSCEKTIFPTYACMHMFMNTLLELINRQYPYPSAFGGKTKTNNNNNNKTENILFLADAVQGYQLFWLAARLTSDISI